MNNRPGIVGSCLTLTLPMLLLTAPACGSSSANRISDYPSRAVTLVVGFSPGGGVDTATRGLQPYLQEILGATVIVENRPGSNSLIAANHVASSRPDGYTLMVGTNAMILNSQLYPDSWKSAKPFLESFIPIYSWVNEDGNGIVVKREAPYSSMADLAEKARHRGIRICIAGGMGSSDQVTALIIRKLYGGEWIIIPMDSAAEATASVLGENCDAASGSPASSSMDPTRLKMLAVTTAARSARWPDTPTFAELGKPEATLPLVIGAMAPLDTPQEIVDKLSSAFARARNHPGFLAWARQTNQPIGDEAWDAPRFREFLKTSQASFQQILPEMAAELHKAQGGR